jgi:AAA ATPase domain
MGVSGGDPGTGLLDRRGERAAVDGVLDRARAGSSAVLVVRGEPGIGKTVLLDYAAGRASASDLRVVRAWGVESEMGAGVRRAAPVVRADARPAGTAAEAAA